MHTLIVRPNWAQRARWLLSRLPICTMPVVLAAELQPVPKFALPSNPIAIRQAVHDYQPFTVAGERGALVGQQSGSFEAWAFPTKILSNLQISAELADYPVPIQLSEYASWIEVNPGRTTITYSHAAFTVKQHMFSSQTMGPVAFFEIASARPLVLTFRFTPEMLRMWPASNFGRPNGEWVTAGSSGYYVLHTDDEKFTALVGMPRTRPGILAPYQERPKTYPLELKLSFDPKRDSDFFFPLIMLVNAGPEQLEELNRKLPSVYQEEQNYYDHFFDRRLWVDTPDDLFNEAMKWAEMAIDQCRVRFQNEMGLVAGFYSSGDSARPGFAWFFGRDTLFSLYAIHSYGDFKLAREAFDFLASRQRADGKIMHEYSQTANLVDWKALPYWYAAADATPLFVMVMGDYVRITGDMQFLRQHWDAVKRAYAFTRQHDSDGDGIYENTEGTGWVESWPPKMPHQEIYLAALDQQSSASIANLAALLHEDDLAQSARSRAGDIRKKLFSEYYDPASKFYAFSRNPDGTTDKAATMFPAVAWWDGTLTLPEAGPMLSRWASHEFSTDWGIRDLSERAAFFDPISYHQGSVWPLYTGWAAVAEYRAGRPLSGYAHLMQNAGLTYSQDLGSVTELLSGEFFAPLGRSTSHQLWSSAMVVTPALRGLFGLDWDAIRHTLRVTPHLPVTWSTATIHNVPFGEGLLAIKFTRERGSLRIEAISEAASVLCLAANSVAVDRECKEAPSRSHAINLPLPAVEIGLIQSLPDPGSVTSQLKVLDERQTANQFVLTLEAQGGSTHELPVRKNVKNVRVAGAEIFKDKLRVHFPQGAGYQTQAVTLSW